MAQHTRFKRTLTGGAVLLLLLLMSACRFAAPGPLPLTDEALNPPQSVSALANEVYIGEVIEPPRMLQDFTLPSSRGRDMRLSELNGQWRLMFFGYLHCPDFCPLTLAEYRQVKRLLGEDARQITFVYISVDGLRDSGDAMRAYLANFDPEFVGFSGDDETLARIQPDYGFYYQRQLQTGSQAVYSVDHSTRSYLVDPTGHLRATFPYDIEPDAIAQAIRWYLES